MADFQPQISDCPLDVRVAGKSHLGGLETDWSQHTVDTVTTHRMDVSHHDIVRTPTVEEIAGCNMVTAQCWAVITVVAA